MIRCITCNQCKQAKCLKPNENKKTMTGRKKDNKNDKHLLMTKRKNNDWWKTLAIAMYEQESR